MSNDTETTTDTAADIETQTETKPKKGKKPETDGVTRRSIEMWDPNDLVVIGLDTEDGPEHYLYDVRVKMPTDETLVLNIMAFGVIQPIVGARDGDKMLVVAGRRRVIAAREAAKRQKAMGLEQVKVPVALRRGVESILFGVSRAENALRVNDSPMTNAMNAQRMLDMGTSEEDIAITFGVKKQTVKDWLSLLDLAPAVRKAVDKNLIAASSAAGLVSLSKEEQETHLADLLKDGAKPSFEKVNNKVREAKGKEKSITPKDRVAKASDLILGAVEEYGEIEKMAKADLVALVDKLAKATMSKGIAKIATEVAKAAEAEAIKAKD